MNRLTIDEAKTRVTDGLSDIFETKIKAGDYDNRLDIRLQHHDSGHVINIELIGQQFTNEERLQQFIHSMRERSEHLG